MLRKVAEEVRRAAEAPGGRIEVEKPLRDAMRKVAMPLELGTMHEQAFILDRRWANHFERKSAEQPGELTVARLRAWIDEPKVKGLPRDFQDLVVLAFADQTQRTFFLGNAPFRVDVGSLRDELVLRSQDLPPEETWRKASERANAVFGWAGGSHRTAANVASLIEALRKKVAEAEEPARLLRDVLLGRLQARGISESDSTRFSTARAACDLVASVRKAADAQVCEVFAGAALPTPEQHVARSLAAAGDVTRALRETRWEALDQALKLPGTFLEAAKALAGEVDDALRKDEFAAALRPVLEGAERRALKLTGDYLASTTAPTPQPTPAPTPPQPAPTPPLPPPPSPRVVVEEGSRELRDAASARSLFGELEGKLAKAAGSRLRLTWTIEAEVDRK